jgi:hypothetical protein
MILLDKKEYNKLLEPLTKVLINNLFARSVIEKCVTGKVYVNKINNPTTFYVVHPYGISLLFGNCNNNDFNEKFKEYALNTNKVRDKHEWMQAYPRDWDKVLDGLFKGHLVKFSENIENNENIIELNTRVNFKFNIEKYLNFKRENLTKYYEIVRTDKQMFHAMRGSVIPLYFWDNADEFYKNGVGFSLFSDKKLASTAYAAFILDDNKLEIGIETVEEFRGKGFAQYTCSSLIDYCISHKYEPIWSCKRENTNSYRLAQKLGFEPTLEIPFYRLSK